MQKNSQLSVKESRDVHTHHIPETSAKAIPDVTVLGLMFSEVVAACADNAYKLTAVWESGKPTACPCTSTYSKPNKHLLRLHLMRVS